ncbi:MAG TPA: DUF5985 family protein [Chroococcales cyanobacterium]
MPQFCYALCAMSSICCFALLLRGYLRSRAPLLLWSSASFFFMAVQSGLLFIDLVVAPLIDLSLWRTLAGFIGSAVLLCCLLWEKS